MVWSLLSKLTRLIFSKLKSFWNYLHFYFTNVVCFRDVKVKYISLLLRQCFVYKLNENVSPLLFSCPLKHEIICMLSLKYRNESHQKFGPTSLNNVGFVARQSDRQITSIYVTASKSGLFRTLSECWMSCFNWGRSELQTNLESFFIKTASKASFSAYE